MPQAASIDSFVDEQADPWITTCGKIAIARAILAAEQESPLYYELKRVDSMPNFNELGSTWFAVLKDILFEGCRKDQIAQRLSEVAFIVFNYDRCIEQFLLHTLRNYYNLTEVAAATLVNQAVIRHPYGVVGRLPWQGGNAPFGIEAQKG